jgi:hypothetical protein
MNSHLILGDIEVNTINGRKLPQNATFIINNNNINEVGKISIPFFELQLKEPIMFNCLYNNETFYPDYQWNTKEKILELDFAFKPNASAIIKLVFILNN